LPVGTSIVTVVLNGFNDSDLIGRAAARCRVSARRLRIDCSVTWDLSSASSLPMR
jgi:hypothetical protein